MFETSGTICIHQATQCHIPKDRKPGFYGCKTLKNCKHSRVAYEAVIVVSPLAYIQKDLKETVWDLLNSIYILSGKEM